MESPDRFEQIVLSHLDSLYRAAVATVRTWLGDLAARQRLAASWPTGSADAPGPGRASVNLGLVEAGEIWMTFSSA